MSIGGDIKDNGFNLSNKYVGKYSGIGSWTYHKSAQKTSSVDIPTFNDANWHQVVAVRNNDSIKLYLDGMYIGSDFTGDGAGYTGGGLGFYVGCRTGNTLFFEGVVDDVRIWKRALGDSEVAQLYNSTATAVSPIQSEEVSNLSVYPIPSSGKITINQIGHAQVLNVHAINALGQVSAEFIITEVPENIAISKRGIYFLQFTNEQGQLVETRKIIIQ